MVENVLFDSGVDVVATFRQDNHNEVRWRTLLLFAFATRHPQLLKRKRNKYMVINANKH